jgi:Rrf2 family protein
VRLEVTQRADLAVRALVALAEARARLKSGQLASALGSTPGFVPQVMAPLVRAGWVRSEPGPTGGYELLIGLDQVNVLTVVEMVDGPTDDGRCVVAVQPCSARQPCPIHTAWARAREELMGALGAVTVAEAGRW